MKVHIENIPAHNVIFMRRTGPYGEQNFQLMQNMKQWISDHNLWSQNSVIYGIARDDAAITPPEKCRYDVCFVTETSLQDGTMNYGTLPSGEYLVFEIPHTSDEVQRFWGSITDTLAQEKREIDYSRPVLERYQIALVEKGFCEFCIPIIS